MIDMRWVAMGGLLAVVVVAVRNLDSPDPAAGGDAATFLAELRSADSALQAAIEARDPDAVAAFYADDAVLLPVAEPIVEGRAAIRDEWAHVLGIPGFSNQARLVAADAAASGDLGYTRGTYQSPMLAPDGGEVIERGKWVSIWRRGVDGAWRITVDIFNTDEPPPDHQASIADTHGGH